MADISITAANVQPGSNAKKETGVAGATVTAGQLVYKDASDSNKFKLADCDSATAAARDVYGVALHGAAAGQPLTVQTAGNITIGATVTSGIPYFSSGTAGGICPFADMASGDYPTFVGWGISATQIKLGISYAGVVI